MTTPCKFCGEQIQETARKCKHCQSFQDAADAPRPSFDLATLVISFVGVIATIGTIAAGVFGYLGFRTVADISDRTRDINEKSSALLATVEQRIKGFDTDVTKLSGVVLDLQKQAAGVRTDLNEVAISRLYERFEQALDAIQLDYAYNFSQQIEEMTKLAETSVALMPVSEIAKTHVTEMNTLSDAVRRYRDALKDDDKDEYIEVTRVLGPISDENLGKSRLLIGCYSHLGEIARRAGRTNEFNDYLSKQKHYSVVALRAAQRLNRTATIAKVNYASTLIEGGDPEEMKKGYDLLIEARKDAPQMAGITYNIAVYFVKINKFDEALANLEQAKALGDFATCNDLRQWALDKDFDTLRLSQITDHQNRLKKLQSIGQGPC
jgi:tetratricopeptide (TPR) repeat protein